ncbi:peptidylprolyl isomerase [Gloeocapsopsis crepidinum LEGE 06123]|uniref:peptidylprolyl isomerase n=1 Tax=Gloeocapsopsis crepidinum LEGE 06123 TaxID=588587 RepID=A0ABR9USK9_9CHRO|nr:peptidylprolyl isomerase [Gloeocapsopsis crepidinum]MBE9191256.1 peptidylprolyl isomerase [Gloeocapsopsis crepidinum LEGE 06123]
MLEVLTISQNDIVHQIKLSCELPSILESIMTRQIITRAASEIGIKVELEELQQAVDNFRLMNHLGSTDATWLWLQKHSLSLDDLEEIATVSVLFSKLSQYLFAAQVEHFFVEHQLDCVQIVMYEVILDDEDLAMELFYAIKEGEISFSEVAHQYIQDPELRRKGGYLGKLKRIELKPEISTAVFSATPPAILKPILTAQGAHLILVEEFIQPKLDNVLRYNILSNLFSEWLKQQIEQFQVKID